VKKKRLNIDKEMAFLCNMNAKIMAFVIFRDRDKNEG